MGFYLNKRIENKLDMNKLIILTLAVVLLCTRSSLANKMPIPEETPDIFDDGFRSSLIENLPPHWAGKARSMQAAIEGGIRCFDPEKVCGSYKDGVRGCIKHTFESLTKGKKSISPKALMKGKRFFLPCIRKTRIEKDKPCVACMTKCLKKKN